VIPNGTISVPAASAAAVSPGAWNNYHAKKRHRMRVVRATLAVADRERGLYPRVNCGRQFRHRTVIVYVEFPAERPSASLSQGVVVVFRAADGLLRRSGC
jgi:hypothetical protein